MGCLEIDPKLSVLVSRVMKNTKLNYVMVLRIGSIKDYNEALSPFGISFDQICHEKRHLKVDPSHT